MKDFYLFFMSVFIKTFYCYLYYYYLTYSDYFV